MCGRYLFRQEVDEEIERLLNELPLSTQQELSLHEVFPTQKTFVIDENQKYKVMQWGYEKWDAKGVVINARSETIKDSSFFNNDLKERRCIIKAKGFYEWNSDKEKNLVTPSKDDYFYMAGLYTDSEIPRFAIITTESDGDFKNLHNRIPLMIPKAYIQTYLDNGYQVFEDFTLLKQMDVKWENQSVQTRLF